MASPPSAAAPVATASAASSVRIIRSGVLLKQGYVVKSWKERVFALYEDTGSDAHTHSFRLAYFSPSDWADKARDGDSSPSKCLGMILLSDVSSVTPLRNRCAFSLRVGGSHDGLRVREREYILLSISSDDRKAWVEDISRAMLTPSRLVTLLSSATALHKTGALCSRGLACVAACLSSGDETQRSRAVAILDSAEATPASGRGSDACEGSMLDFRLARSEGELLHVCAALQRTFEVEEACDGVRERLVDTAMAQFSASGEESPGRWTPAVQAAFALVLHAIAMKSHEVQVEGGREAGVEDAPAMPTAATEAAAAPAGTCTAGTTEGDATAVNGDPLYDLREESRFMDDYALGECVGTGAYSRVHVCIHMETGETCAVKIARKARLTPVETARLVDEVSIMSVCDHDHIVRMRAFYEDDAAFYIVCEYMHGGELFDRIVTRGTSGSGVYTERDAREIVRVLADACVYMHSRGVVHRDLKPENILLSHPDESRAVIKIADMGFAKRLPRGGGGLHTSCGTPSYVSPDILLGRPYGCEVDVWSLGVITYILLCGYAPFAAATQTDLFRAIVCGRFDFNSSGWERVSSVAKDLISHMLCVDPTRRYTSAQVLSHPWFSGTVSHVELSLTLTHMRSFQHARRCVIKRGELIKQGHILRSLKRRTFILTSDTLEYYDPLDAAATPAASSAAGEALPPPPASASQRQPSPGLRPAVPVYDASVSHTVVEGAITGRSDSSSARSASGETVSARVSVASSVGMRPKGIIALKDVRTVTPVDAHSVLSDIVSAIGIGLGYVTGGATPAAPAPAPGPTGATNTTPTSSSRPSPLALPPTASSAAATATSPGGSTGEFWFKLSTLSGREYCLCADSDASRRDWIRSISGALATGDLMRKTALALAGERMTEAVALMRMAQEWQVIMGDENAESAGAAAPMSVADAAKLRRATRIQSKVTAAMAAASGGAAAAATPAVATRSSAPAAAALAAGIVVSSAVVHNAVTEGQPTAAGVEPSSSVDASPASSDGSVSSEGAAAAAQPAGAIRRREWTTAYAASAAAPNADAVPAPS